MTILQSNFVTRKAAVTVGDCAGDIVVNRFYIDLGVADLALNNQIDLGILPAGHTVVDAVLISDDLDTGTTLALDVGIMSGSVGDAVSVRTVGNELFQASTLSETGGVARISAASAFTVVAQPYDRSIGVLVKTAPAGGIAGRLRLLVTMAPVNSGHVY